MGPIDMDDPDPLEVGPHPHIGLSTVTWLLEGEALHTDSLGTEQVIRAGQLNLMTAGHGISHAELAAHPPFQGAQLWIAQPEGTRHGASAFEHHAELPHVELAGTGGTSEATLLIGTLADGTAASARRPARTRRSSARTSCSRRERRPWCRSTPPSSMRSRRSTHPCSSAGTSSSRARSRSSPPASTRSPLTVREGGARILLLGGEPLDSPVVMWWNFVARDRDEITDAWRSWNARDERFGTVASPLDRIEAPAPPWVRA
jgi:quercetin 2,3-dioxygenase